MKVLIIRFSSIGDIVLTTPVIRCVKEQIPRAEVHYLTKEKFSSLLKANPFIDHLHQLNETNLGEIIKTLKSENFDFIIDLHNSLRSRFIYNRLRRPGATFPKLNFKKFLLTKFHINTLPDAHIVDRYFKAAKHLEIRNDQKGLDYFIPEQERTDFKLPEGFESSFIAFAIGGTYPTKRLPEDRIMDLCRRINKKIILLGGKEDSSTGEKIATFCGRDKVYNACGKYNLNGSALILEAADCVISHDTGMMHIAAALKKRIISVWGNTVPEFGMYPYLPGEGSFIAEVKGLPCRPCSKLGYPHCPKKHFHCMNLQELDVIAEKAET